MPRTRAVKSPVRVIRDYIVSEETLRTIVGMGSHEQIIQASKREWEDHGRKVRGVLIETEEGCAP